MNSREGRIGRGAFNEIRKADCVSNRGLTLRPIDPEIQVSEALSPISVATRCKNLMAEYRSIYIDHVPFHIGDPPIPIRGHDVIHKALDYGAGAIDGVIHFLNIAQPWFAANIVRAYFELVLRIMWCRTRTNGWQELIGWWAEETIKAADRSVADLGKDPLSTTARQLLTGQTSHVARTKPSLDAMLREIARGQSSNAARTHIEGTYAELFKGSLHQAAHANIAFLALQWSDGDQLAIGRALVRACWWLINSSHSYIGWDESQAIQFMNSHLRV
jgi:hypothetical protein